MQIISILKHTFVKSLYQFHYMTALSRSSILYYALNEYWLVSSLLSRSCRELLFQNVRIHAKTMACRAPGQRPPVALRYAMWTLAASVVEKFMDLRDHFYQRARKYMEADYLKGHGEHMISIAHAQTHALLASYEFKMMYFPRAWMSTGSAIRMCQM